MNSEEGCTAPKARPGLGVPRSILLIAIAFEAILISIGVLLIFPIKHSFDAFGMHINLSMSNAGDLTTAWTFSFIPAAVYAVGVLLYGRALFGETETLVRARAWWRLVQLSGVLFFVTILHELLQSIYKVPWGQLALAILVWGTLILLWAYVGRLALFKAIEKGSIGWEHKALMLAGSAMILQSTALPIDYDSPGWSVLIWRSEWPTLQFAAIKATIPWLKAICLAGYAAGLLLAVLSIWIVVRMLAKKTLGAGPAEWLRSLSVVVFWFAVTNYLCSCLLEQYVGIFLGRLYGLNAVEFAVITSAWLVMLAAGILLWFKYGLRTDEKGRNAKNALLLWALPLVPLTMYRFPDALGWDLYGLILFEMGVWLVTASWWKIAEAHKAAAVPASEVVNA
jgi:hypothetical protein